MVTVLWTHSSPDYDGKAAYLYRVAAEGTSGRVALVNAEGNASIEQLRDGALMLSLTDMPLYVVSTDQKTTRQQVMAPEGY